MATSFIDAVIQAWDFAVPPVVTILLALLIVVLLVPRQSLRLWVRLRRRKLPFPGTLPHQLEAYGVTKVAPVAALFAAAFVIYAANILIEFVGNAVPGQVSYSNLYLLAHAGHDRLFADMRGAGLLSPTNNYDEAFRLDRRIQFLAATDSDAVLATTRPWRDSYAHNRRLLTITKFLALWLFATFVYVSSRKLRNRGTVTRFLLLLVVLFGFAVYFVVKQVYAIEQLGYGEVNALYSSLNDVDTKRIALPSSGFQSASDQGFWNEVDHRWWTLGLFDWHYPRWLYQTFVTRSSPSPYEPVRVAPPFPVSRQAPTAEDSPVRPASPPTR